MREDPTKPAPLRATRARADDETEAERAFFCASCQTRLADATATFSPSGERCRFVFANPAGRLFEIVTLREASNVLPLGEATLEFTWFPGFAWRALVCASCGTHLGWRFDAEGASFVAFITAEVVEG